MRLFIFLIVNDSLELKSNSPLCKSFILSVISFSCCSTRFWKQSPLLTELDEFFFSFISLWASKVRSYLCLIMALGVTKPIEIILLTESATLSLGLRDDLSVIRSEGDLRSAEDLVVDASVVPLPLYESAVVLCFEEYALCFKVILFAKPGAYFTASSGFMFGKCGCFCAF